MSLQQIGFLDVSYVAAAWITKFRKEAQDGILKLRDFEGEDVVDLPVLTDYRNAKALLARLKAGAAPFFDNIAPLLGMAWIEVLPPHSGTLWEAREDDYAQGHVRTRTCLVPSPGAISHCGQVSANLLVGNVTALDMKLLCCEVNHSEHPRVHLVADVKVPDGAEP